GWTGEYDWTGFVPFAELPQATDPASGYFITANNKIVPSTYPYFLSRDWDLPNRAERIEELLAATPRQSAGASGAIQADTLSIMARRLVPLMIRIAPGDDMAREAVERLREAYGPEMARWEWGRAHVARFPNPVLGRIAMLGDWLRVGIPTSGGYDTLNRGPSTIRDDAHPYEQRFGAGLRIITDLAAPVE